MWPSCGSAGTAALSGNAAAPILMNNDDANPPKNTACPSNPSSLVISSPISGTAAADNASSDNANPIDAVAPGARAKELVSTISINPRSLMRHTRITYDSLRTFLHQAKHLSPDMDAANLMMEKDLYINRDRRIIGTIPGLRTGEIFFFRIELCVLGLIHDDIDSISTTLNPSGEPIATSIVVSSGHENRDEDEDILIYTYRGGRQKLEGGNLALNKSLERQTDIRVFRDVKYENSPMGRVYVYDGIYRATKSWREKGRSRNRGYQYKLLRLEGQPQMGSSILKIAHGLKLNPQLIRPEGYASLDVSKGMEKVPIYVFNDIDDDSEPLNVEYVARPVYPRQIMDGGEGAGRCRCLAACGVDCSCIQRNGGEFVYDATGILLKGKPLIYECGPKCWCPPGCQNRVSQKGISQPLEIFRSAETEWWAVRCLEPIRAGTFICEFTGTVVNNPRAMNEDGLVYPRRFPARWEEWGDLSEVFPDYKKPNHPSLPQLSFGIDTSDNRNVACYMSHNESPNAFVQFVMFDDQYNEYYSHVMIFAMENIPPMRELSIDIGLIKELGEDIA